MFWVRQNDFWLYKLNTAVAARRTQQCYSYSYSINNSNNNNNNNDTRRRHVEHVLNTCLTRPSDYDYDDDDDGDGDGNGAITCT